MFASCSDSGSNNFTMAREMHRQLQDESIDANHQLAWEPTTMTIRCFCHKMGLIVKAGIDALGLKPLFIRHSTLGRFPPVQHMAVINEQEECSTPGHEDDDHNDSDRDDADMESHYSDDSNASTADPEEPEEDLEQQDEPENWQRRKTAYLLGDTYMNQLTKDMDTVNKKLTRSSGHQADFNRRRERANVIRKTDELPPLKALLSGHGICWGIRAERWERMWEAQDLIDRVMKEDLAEVHSKKRWAKKDGKKHGYFEESIFSVADWQAMRDMLDILTPYKILTREMEGDKPTGCLVLVKYVQLKASMETRLKKMHPNNPLYPMVDVMIDKIIAYLNEALACNTLTLAAVFHPGLRVKFFSHSFGMGAEGNNRAEDLLRVVFNEKRNEMDLDNQPAAAPSTSKTPTVDAFGSQMTSFYGDIVESSNLNELDRYIQGVDPMITPDLNDPQLALDWWNAHAGKYPVLSALARDYLATPAASGAPERLFSVAGRICTAERGGLAPQMIKMSVSGQLWVNEGVPLGGDFAEVTKVMAYSKKAIKKKTRNNYS